jgi:uncharacterized protein YdaU (DUF1376 family)
MSDRLPWFRCFPSALLGALAGLPADEGFVYVVTLMRIYETGGPVVETPRTLARRTGMTERRAANALDELIAMGKLDRLADGRLDAESTHDEIEWQQGMRNANSVAGKKSAEKRAGKSHQNQRSASTTVQQSSDHLRVESKEESSDTNVSSLSERMRKPEWPSDYRDQVWALYPKHTEKKDGMAALDALHRADKLPWDVLRSGIERFKAHLSDPQFAPALHRWLKKELWNDEYPPRSTAPPPRPERREPVSKNPFVADLLENMDPRHDTPDDDLSAAPYARSHGPRLVEYGCEIQELSRGNPRPVPQILDLSLNGSFGRRAAGS